MKHDLGLIRDLQTVMERGRQLAEKYGAANFKCSKGYVDNAKRRNRMDFKNRTTLRQTTIRAYIKSWQSWIITARAKASAAGIVKDGYIDGIHAANLDEFALCPDEKNKTRKHLSPSRAEMVNAGGLLSTFSECKRLCTVLVFAPMCGWNQC